MQLAELLVVEVQRVEQLAVDVELCLAPGAVADPDGRRVAPPAQVRQLALGEVVLAADPVHDLQRVLSPAPPPAEDVMNETKSLASSGQAPM